MLSARVFRIVSTVVLFSAACDPAPSVESCPGAGSEAPELVEMTTHFDPRVEPIREDLVVSGTAIHTEGFAIREITVGGVPATNEGFNFRTWKVTIPLVTLREMQGNADGPSVMLPVVVHDACGRRIPSSEVVSVRLLEAPVIDVSGLTVDVAYPAGQDFLPATKDDTAIVVVSALASATGASIELMPDDDVQGTSNGRVVLIASGGRAEARAFFGSDEPGVHLITAVSDGGEFGSERVRVAGPPTISPLSFDGLVPGQRITVDVRSAGGIDTCTALTSSDITVDSGGSSLVGRPVAVDGDGDGVAQIVVGVLPSLVASTDVTISCRDAFDQAETVTYSARPSGP